MPEITFKKETAPARCEICHQVDMFDAEHNHCARCDVLAVREMSAAADAAIVIAVAPPTPPQIWRFTGVMPMLLLGLCFFLGIGVGVAVGTFLGAIVGFLALPLTMAAGYFGGVAFEALIKTVIRARTGSLPMDINRLIDDWFGISAGLCIAVFYVSLFFLAFLGENAVFLLLPVPIVSMLLGLAITLKKRRRISIRSVRVDRKSAL